jgi:hypothetical protein
MAPDISPILAAAFQKEEKPYLSVSNLVKAIPAPVRRDLGLTSVSKPKDVLQALGPLPSPYIVLRKGNSTGILAAPPAEAILKTISRVPGKTLGQVHMAIPLKKEDVIKELNHLLLKKSVRVEIAATGAFRFYIDGQGAVTTDKESDAATPPAVPGDRDGKLAAFKAAFDAIYKKHRFVFIHQVRRALGWPREVFDLFLESLMIDGTVAAHPGNPGALRRSEVEDSYQNDLGDLFLSVSWRRPL